MPKKNIPLTNQLKHIYEPYKIAAAQDATANAVTKATIALIRAFTQSFLT